MRCRLWKAIGNVAVRPIETLTFFVCRPTTKNPFVNAHRIYSGEIGDVGVVGGTKVTNSCVKTAPGAAEVSLEPT